VVARALSGLEMFSGQLSELVSGEIAAPAAPASVCLLCTPLFHPDTAKYGENKAGPTMPTRPNPNLIIVVNAVIVPA